MTDPQYPPVGDGTTPSATETITYQEGAPAPLADTGVDLLNLFFVGVFLVVVGLMVYAWWMSRKRKGQRPLRMP